MTSPHHDGNPITPLQQAAIILTAACSTYMFLADGRPIRRWEEFGHEERRSIQEQITLVWDGAAKEPRDIHQYWVAQAETPDDVQLWESLLDFDVRFYGLFWHLARALDAVNFADDTLPEFVRDPAVPALLIARVGHEATAAFRRSVLDKQHWSTREFSWPDLSGNQRKEAVACVESILENFDDAETTFALIEHNSDERVANDLALGVVRALGSLEVVPGVAAHPSGHPAASDAAEGGTAKEVAAA